MISKDTSLDIVQDIASECTKCGHCCSTGSGFAIDEDLPIIAAFLDMSVDTLKEKHMDAVTQFNTTLFRPKLKKYPVGRCTFLTDDNLCGIHEVKPLQCKTGNLFAHSADLRTWFALNYQVKRDDPVSLEEWASYLKHGGNNIPGGEL